MGGRDMAGSDGRGALGDVGDGVELIEEPKAASAPKAAAPRELAHRVERKIARVGLLVILLGVFVWLWPKFDMLVLYQVELLSLGPRLAAYGVLLILLGVILKRLIPLVSGIISE